MGTATCIKKTMHALWQSSAKLTDVLCQNLALNCWGNVRVFYQWNK